MANVKVRLKDASNNILHPETEWSVISNKPDYIPTDARNIAFGRYMEHPQLGLSKYYPAIRTIEYNSVIDTFEYECYYFNGTSWTKISDESDFIPGI